MKKVFIVGAAGGVGVPLAHKLVTQGVTPVGLCRRDDQAQQLARAGGIPVVADLRHESAESLAAAMVGCDAVVFSAGAGGKGGRAMIDAIDRTAALQTITAAQMAGVDKFLMVSAMPPNAEDVPEFSKDFRYYFVVKREVDAYLAATTLAWIILRPGRLTDDPASGRVSAGQAIASGAISRADVAAFIVQALQHELHHLVIELTSGSTAIEHAVSSLPHTSL